MDHPALLIFLLVVGCTSAFHLFARATLTQSLHSQYPPWLAGFANCAACSGTWFGMILAGGYVALGGTVANEVVAVVPMIMVGGWLGMILTPPLAWLHESALRGLAGEADAPLACTCAEGTPGARSDAGDWWSDGCPAHGDLAEAWGKVSDARCMISELEDDAQRKAGPS